MQQNLELLASMSKYFTCFVCESGVYTPASPPVNFWAAYVSKLTRRYYSAFYL